MFKQKEIKSLLSSLIIFSAEEKQSILSQYGNATKSSVENLVKILSEATKKQEEYIEKIVKANPKFAEDMKKFLHDMVANFKGTVDASDKAALEKLEQQFT